MHIIVKLNSSYEQFKNRRGKYFFSQSSDIRLRDDFSKKMIEYRNQWEDTCKEMKKTKTC